MWIAVAALYKWLFGGCAGPGQNITEFGEASIGKKLTIVTDSGSLVQISSAKASKEQAIAMICERLDIPLERVVVFGDDYNDVGLFRDCGWPVAMGNAIPELKRLAREIADTNDNDGVAKVLERLMDRRASVADRMD